ncbi:hypothetical protein AX14_003424 [Amanita brunnescens Koide BX004]|nr:hypothetical protein AX14_003424 [Amanita brunnescens Koide BX004]
MSNCSFRFFLLHLTTSHGNNRSIAFGLYRVTLERNSYYSSKPESTIMSVDVSKLPVPPLPTLPILNATVPSNLDIEKVASEWLDSLSKAIDSNNPDDAAGLFVEDSWWRDMLALTWDFRTFHGVPAIRTFLCDRIGSTHPRAFKLRKDYLGLQRPYEDLAWINAFFDFETDTGFGFGIFRLVPTATGEWKAHVVYTNLEDLKGFPEKIGALRNSEPNHGHWEEDRNREKEFKTSDPVVLVIGGGQSGLEVAARLKSLEIPTLVIERSERIGDSWRNRYEALCLHDSVWYDHMPYLPFPPSWPVYCPARKIANWLENYAETLELNVWTSSVVTQAVQDSTSKHWKVTVKRGNEETERIFNVKHVIFATGFGSSVPNIPKVPGAGKFKGQILHSIQHKRATDHAGKKVVVVGACTSAHDIAHDFYNHGIDVTMYQRSSTYVMTVKNGLDVLFSGVYCENGPPTDIADRIVASYPHFMGLGLGQRSAARIAELDKDLLNALHKRGFRTNLGIHESGLGMLVWDKGSGYYLDVGASQLIADGKIKLKNDSQIKEFTETGLLFEDGSQLSADVVLFATGYGNVKEHIQSVCGDEVANSCSPIWGFNMEGELNGCWRDLGVPGLWYMMGNLALCRFHSKHIALQIKAAEEGVFGQRYSLSA